MTKPWIERFGNIYYACAWTEYGDHIIKYGPYRWRFLAWWKTWRL
jgi:hypothetical protein